MNYKPMPVDTSNVRLPDEILHLQEAIAKNIHEQWAKNRMDEGWTYGTERNDQKKTHPCLIPYEKLPETEKHYDRVTAMETLKFILKMGYKIEKEVEGECMHGRKK